MCPIKREVISSERVLSFLTRQDRPVIIGLCGGIASGKSTVARIFRDLGKGVIIDADKIAHRLLNKPAIKKKIINLYKKETILTKKLGLINRRRLGEIVFAHEDNLKKLNEILHPIILKEITATLKKICQTKVSSSHFHRKDQIGYKNEDYRNHKKLVILDAALLIETGLDRVCDYLVFVNTSLERRFSRAARSRSWTRKELKRRENFQLSLRDKKQKADFIINNNFSLVRTRSQVRKILQKIL